MLILSRNFALDKPPSFRGYRPRGDDDLAEPPRTDGAEGVGAERPTLGALRETLGALDRVDGALTDERGIDGADLVGAGAERPTLGALGIEGALRGTLGALGALDRIDGALTEDRGVEGADLDGGAGAGRLTLGALDRVDGALTEERGVDGADLDGGAGAEPLTLGAEGAEGALRVVLGALTLGEEPVDGAVLEPRVEAGGVEGAEGALRVTLGVWGALRAGVRVGVEGAADVEGAALRGTVTLRERLLGALGPVPAEVEGPVDAPGRVMDRV